MITSLYSLVGHLSILITEHLVVSRVGFVSSLSHSKFGLLYCTKCPCLLPQTIKWNLVSESFECTVMIIYEFIFGCWPVVHFVH
jgi:hypothetical protein